MLKVVIKTATPQWCMAKKLDNSKIIFKQIWYERDGKIKALVIYKSKKGNNVQIIRDHECHLARTILDSGAIVVSAEVTQDEITWVLACTKDEFKRLLELLENEGFGYEIIWKTKFSEKCFELSYLEEEMLKLALKNGYFDSPKGIKLEELAKLLGLSKSTVSELLRRVVKKIAERYIIERM